MDVTDSARLDCNYLPGLIEQIEGPIEQITGDGAYDKVNCYETAYQRGATPVFPPQHNAAIQRNKIKKNLALIPRDELITQLNSAPDKEEAIRLWKQDNNYHRRSNHGTSGVGLNLMAVTLVPAAIKLMFFCESLFVFHQLHGFFNV